MSNYAKMLTPDDCVLTLIDFQPAMYQGVQSHDRATIMANVQILAETAKVFKVPTVLTSVASNTFSGQFMPEITEGVFPGKPMIERTSINSWLDPKFREAIKATGKKRVVIAGLWTCACVSFPTFDMLKEGFEVFVVADACGDTNLEPHDRAMDRMVQAGAVPVTALQFLFELQQDWARTETYPEVMEILKKFTPYGVQVRFSKWALGDHPG
ncbi:hydrolase [Entomobacter blattae]|nr:hydrolase [Entomobacter blattae]